MEPRVTGVPPKIVELTHLIARLFYETYDRLHFMPGVDK